MRNYLDLEGVSVEELVEMKEDIDQDITSIKIQIDAAKSKAIDGEYADKDWWLRVNGALKIKGRQSQQLQNALSKARKKEKEKQQNRFERYFVNVAKEELSFEVFNKIFNLAKEKMQ